MWSPLLILVYPVFFLPLSVSCASCLIAPWCPSISCVSLLCPLSLVCLFQARAGSLPYFPHSVASPTQGSVVSPGASPGLAKWREEVLQQVEGSCFISSGGKQPIALSSTMCRTERTPSQKLVPKNLQRMLRVKYLSSVAASC